MTTLLNFKDEGLADHEIAHIINEKLMPQSHLLNDVTIDLSGNNLGPEGALALSDLLTRTDGIRRLILQGNRVPLSYEFCQALLCCKGLRLIDLRSNGITDNGVNNLAYALSQNPLITHIDLSHNHITNGGAEALSVALDQNTCIIHLNLLSNDISGELIDEVESKLNPDPRLNSSTSSSSVYNKKSLSLRDSFSRERLERENVLESFRNKTPDYLRHNSLSSSLKRKSTTATTTKSASASYKHRQHQRSNSRSRSRSRERYRQPMSLSSSLKKKSLTRSTSKRELNILHETIETLKDELRQQEELFESERDEWQVELEKLQDRLIKENRFRRDAERELERLKNSSTTTSSFWEDKARKAQRELRDTQDELALLKHQLRSNDHHHHHIKRTNDRPATSGHFESVYDRLSKPKDHSTKRYEQLKDNVAALRRRVRSVSFDD